MYKNTNTASYTEDEHESGLAPKTFISVALVQKIIGNKIRQIKHMRKVVKTLERGTQWQGVSLRTGYF